MKRRQYKVAGHVFGVETADGIDLPMNNYKPFDTEDEPSLFVLTIDENALPTLPDGCTEERRQEEEGQSITSYSTGDGRYAFRFELQQMAAILVTDSDYKRGWLTAEKQSLTWAVDNSLMLLYALASAPHSTLLFHSSVVVNEGRAYLFLGVSGTGKSTHTSLWMRHIDGCTLLNDDNPVVRVDDQGTAIAYGSPWSGKTPCYKNLSFPVGAIVKLHQYPSNRIKPLSKLHGYIAIAESVSGKTWDKAIAEGQHQTKEAIVKNTEVYYLDCLPDRDAALLCRETVSRRWRKR